MREKKRVLWRCRRGMLELDIVLMRFVEEHFDALTDAQHAALEALLDEPDNDLWDMISGRKLPAEARQRELLEWIATI
jgi:antitoxin CptB